MHASLPHPHSGPLSVAPSIPTQPASFLAPSTPSARLPLIQVSFFNPLLASCFCPLHAVQSSTCFSGVHHFFHPSSPVRFPCSCFSLPYFCTPPPQHCPFYSLHPSISLRCGLCASPFSIPPFLLDIHLTSLGTVYVCLCGAAQLLTERMYRCCVSSPF